ncbi:transposase [bacterium]|nr:transposase [bacterium]
MKKDTTKGRQAAREERAGWLEAQLRQRTREWIEEMVEEELDAALGTGRHERSEERLGYRKGRRPRTLTTSNGKHVLNLPRGE